MQISYAVIAKLISAFVFAAYIVQSLYFLIRKFKPLAITARLDLTQLQNPEDRFSCNEAHILNVRKAIIAGFLLHFFNKSFFHSGNAYHGKVNSLQVKHLLIMTSVLSLHWLGYQYSSFKGCYLHESNPANAL